MNIKMVVATHKRYQMPEDTCYLPVQVGKYGKESLGYQGDDTGDNISDKNAYYCELTGLYWAWKNLDADYIGLAHYRRYFASKKRKHMFWKKDPFSKILSDKEIEQLLEKTDIILPAKRHYYIENLYSHYAHTHYEEHLTVTRAIIEQMTPEYLDAYDRVMKKTYGHMFNMFIMSREKCSEYCSWLFPILEELEKNVDYKSYDVYQQRLFGRVSELLLNVWMEQKQYSYKCVPVVNIEKSNLMKRIPAFLKAKFFHKKYKGSF